MSRFDDICRENNLKYWLHGGTLLGSVRGRDFIEWDDDVDVVMPRESFDRLRSMRNELSEEGYYFSFPEDSDYFYDFIPGFYCDEFLVNQKVIGPKGDELGVSTSPKIDIFVLDVCNEGIGHKMTCWRLISKYLLARGHRETRVRLDVKTTPILRPILTIVAKMFELFGAHRNYSKIMKEYESIGKKDRGKGCVSVFLSNDQPWYLYRTFSRDSYENSLDGLLRDRVFSIPVGYDEVLTCLYGDYTVEDSVEHRKPAHYIIK